MYNPSNDHIPYRFSPREFRLVILFTFFVYICFGILDLYMMPINYEIGWIIRFGILGVIITTATLISYLKSTAKYFKIYLFIILIFGQLGIVSMIAFTNPSEPAFYAYYAGLILVMHWGSFIFMLKFRYVLFIVISTIVFYNIVAIFFQNILSFSENSHILAMYLGNNFFLISSALLAIIGAHQLDQHEKKVIRIHQELIEEEAQLIVAKRKAEESDKLKSAFLANMSHEIRTPLNSIIGFSELLLDDDFSVEERKDYTRMIIESGNNLLLIISDILDISKIEAGEVEANFEYFSANQLVAEIHKEYTYRSQAKGIDFRLDLSHVSNEIILNSDIVKIKQILLNFVSNALKFTEHGYIEIGLRPTNDSIQFHVKDTGIGIPAEFHPLLFERFRQIDPSNTRKYGGNGLGLAISKKLAILLGGKIWMESEPGKGSVFYLSIPL